MIRWADSDADADANSDADSDADADVDADKRIEAKNAQNICFRLKLPQKQRMCSAYTGIL